VKNFRRIIGAIFLFLQGEKMKTIVVVREFGTDDIFGIFYDIEDMKESFSRYEITNVAGKFGIIRDLENNTILYFQTEEQ
jgi:hypothetical protein